MTRSNFVNSHLSTLVDNLKSILETPPIKTVSVELLPSYIELISHSQFLQNLGKICFFPLSKDVVNIIVITSDLLSILMQHSTSAYSKLNELRILPKIIEIFSSHEEEIQKITSCQQYTPRIGELIIQISKKKESHTKDIASLFDKIFEAFTKEAFGKNSD